MNERVKTWMEECRTHLGVDTGFGDEYDKGYDAAMSNALYFAEKFGLPDLVEPNPWHTVGGENGVERDYPMYGESVFVYLLRISLCGRFRVGTLYEGKDHKPFWWFNEVDAYVEICPTDRWQRLIQPQAEEVRG